ncbi:unnamed protein product [Spirodela intermedia]|uniref:Peptidase M14 domain-containing protein n=1 Tax=Spirodela intermedia TaxID=51605 RepID=A0A7I8JNI7_SPIIN|nr:unnamed protein product [Spirodela intermedia]CAA6671716.1 unnamed protein product [Spirodela intermedia]
MDVALVLLLFFPSAISLASLLPTPAVARGSLSPRRSQVCSNNPKWEANRHLLESMPEIPVEATHGYMSNVELEQAIKEFSQKCGNISRTYSIGQSVNGFTLWVIEISDKPGIEEAEPAFKFIGNMHGDEPVGRELLLRLANWLCDNFMKDPLATLIVKKAHLHILPTMNPDGFTLKTRGNANNVDLNRDFPDQPETKAVMNWMRKQRFTASASLHGRRATAFPFFFCLASVGYSDEHTPLCRVYRADTLGRASMASHAEYLVFFCSGALVANYPWDGSRDSRKEYYACPDDKTFRYMANVYSLSHRNMSLSNEFPGGITNGASWYPIYGGMQDWNYIHGGCFELTLEVSDVKWPKADELETLWLFNRMSMLNLVAWTIKTGLHGRIVSSSTRQPLPASVTINGIDYKVNASEEFGDYHRMLAPAQSYEVTASMPGYQSKSTRIILLENEAMNLDFVLDPEELTGQDKLGRADFFKGLHLQVYLLASLILLLLYALVKRRQILKVFQHRHPRRVAPIP